MLYILCSARRCRWQQNSGLKATSCREKILFSRSWWHCYACSHLFPLYHSLSLSLSLVLSILFARLHFTLYFIIYSLLLLLLFHCFFFNFFFRHPLLQLWKMQCLNYICALLHDPNAIIVQFWLVAGTLAQLCCCCSREWKKWTGKSIEINCRLAWK